MRGEILKRVIRVLAVLLTAILLFSVPAAADSYTYNYKLEAVPTPEAVSVEIYADRAHMDLPNNETLKNASDIDVDDDGTIYVADTDNGRVLVLDENCKYITSLEMLTGEDGSVMPLVAPKGVYAASDGLIYIADAGTGTGGKVVVIDKEYNLIGTREATSKQVYKEDFVFIPKKVAADRFGRVYVVAENVYDGIMEFDPMGNFLGFTGSPPVSVTLADIFWNAVGSEKMKEQRLKFIPVEFDNIDMDQEDFLYTVTSNVDEWEPEDDLPVRKQTALGHNILKTSPVLGYPIGDIEYLNSSEALAPERLGPSKFVDVSAAESYGYACLDAKRKRVFVYNEDGEILFVFGGEGTTEGYFRDPVAVVCDKNRIYILDKSSSAITVFKMTDYAQLIVDAQAAYIDGNYDESLHKWKQVLKINSNLDMAYSGIGKIYLREGKYEEVLNYFKYAGNKEFYSKAYKYYRDQWLADNFGLVVLFLVGVIALLIVYFKFLRKKIVAKEGLKKYEWYKGLKFGGYIMTHPFDGFWCMVREKKGKMSSAFIIYGLFVVTLLIRSSATGFLFVPLDNEFSLFKTLALATVPLFLWCLCNWSVTTLFDGDGRFRDIVMATAYVLLPFIITSIPVSFLSNVVTIDEGSLLYMVETIGLIWSAFLLFGAMLTIHNYTPAKTIGTIAVSVVGMAAVLFLVVLLFNLVQQMFGFLVSVYSEVTIRM